MKYLKIEKNCRGCGSAKIKKIIKLKDTPINELYEDTLKRSLKHKKYPQTIARCNDCSHIQIIETINRNYMWKKYTYYSSQNMEVVKHFKLFSQKLKKKYNLNNELIVDIGSGDGSLLRNFINKSKTVGVEPSKNVSKNAKKIGIKIINRYFDDQSVNLILNFPKKAKIVTAFNVFAHTPNLSKFIERVKKILDKEGVFIFEAQYLGDIFEKFILGTFFHEHMSHHSVFCLSKLFAKYNLRIIKVEKNNNQNGSIIGYVVHKDSLIKPDNTVKKMLIYEKNKKINTLKTLKTFKNKIKNFKKISKNILKNYNDYYGFGSARSGPIYSENFGIKYPKIVFDDHIDKVNKYIPFYGTKIYPTRLLKKFEKKLIIILAYVYSKKIIQNNIKNIKNGYEFFVFYPKPKLINKENYKKYLYEKS